jgi:transcriptional regulator with XRE-family HTH domain
MANADSVRSAIAARLRAAREQAGLSQGFQKSKLAVEEFLQMKSLALPKSIT